MEDSRAHWRSLTISSPTEDHQYGHHQCKSKRSYLFIQRFQRHSRFFHPWKDRRKIASNFKLWDGQTHATPDSKCRPGKTAIAKKKGIGFNGLKVGNFGEGEKIGKIDFCPSGRRRRR